LHISLYTKPKTDIDMTSHLGIMKLKELRYIVSSNSNDKTIRNEGSRNIENTNISSVDAGHEQNYNFLNKE
jgi:hypothetical protein